jgi:tRNA-intron endonuclease
MPKVWEGELIENRVIIWSPQAIELFEESGYGKPMPFEEPNRLELDLIEATYLVERKKLKVFVKEDRKKRKISLQELMEIGSKNVNQFHPSFIVYRDLRNRGYLCKTGFKFGSLFRVYDRGVKIKKGAKAPHEHTRYVVQPVAEESAFSLPEMSRAVRLAQNIRATLVWAVVDRDNDVTFYIIQRITP